MTPMMTMPMVASGDLANAGGPVLEACLLQVLLVHYANLGQVKILCCRSRNAAWIWSSRYGFRLGAEALEKEDKRRRTKPKEGEKQTIYARTWGDVVAGGLRLTGDVGVLELWIISALL